MLLSYMFDFFTGFCAAGERLCQRLRQPELFFLHSLWNPLCVVQQRRIPPLSGRQGILCAEPGTVAKQLCRFTHAARGINRPVFIHEAKPPRFLFGQHRACGTQPMFALRAELLQTSAHCAVIFARQIVQLAFLKGRGLIRPAVQQAEQQGFRASPAGVNGCSSSPGKQTVACRSAPKLFRRFLSVSHKRICPSAAQPSSKAVTVRSSGTLPSSASSKARMRTKLPANGASGTGCAAFSAAFRSRAPVIG